MAKFDLEKYWDFRVWVKSQIAQLRALLSEYQQNGGGGGTGGGGDFDPNGSYPNMSVGTATKATSATTYSVDDTTKIIGDSITSINGTIDIGYDLDSSTSISNYGTTITDNTDQLVYNGYADKISTDHYANSWIGINDTKVDKTEFDALQKKVEEHLKNELDEMDSLMNFKYWQDKGEQILWVK